MVQYPNLNCPVPSISKPSLDYTAAVPINLAKSLEGKYFIGYADKMINKENSSSPLRFFSHYHIQSGNTGVNRSRQGRFWLVGRANLLVRTQFAS